MESLDRLVCRSFIDKNRPDMKSVLLSFLPEEEKKKLETLPPARSDLTVGFDTVHQLIRSTHHSWFAPFFRTLSQQEIPLFLSALPEQKRIDLSKLLLCSEEKVPLSRPGLRFLQKKLAAALISDTPNFLPEEALPVSALNCVLAESFETILLLIDFLGLYDLAAEMRFIIDKVRVRKIRSALSEEMERFFSAVGNVQTPDLFPRMNLPVKIDDKADLLKQVHARGMNRLAKAFRPEHPSLIFHLKLRIGTDEAALFTSLLQPLSRPKGYRLLAAQIAEVLAFFQHHNLRRVS